MLGILAFSAGLPSAVETGLTVVLVLVMFGGVPLIVFYLLADAGWTTLAKRFRATFPYTGAWRACPTAQMAMVSVDHPDYQLTKARFVSTVRVGTSDQGLYLSMLFGKIPVLGAFFPTVQLPWSEVASARAYEAPGWTSSRSSPGAVSATYDPNYTGIFVELQAGEPPVFLQLPAAIFGDDLSRLPLG